MAQYTIVAQTVRGVEPRRGRGTGRLERLIHLHLVPGPGVCLDNVKAVVYRLSPHLRALQSRNVGSGFAVDAWTTGYFSAEADVVLQDGSTDRAAGRVAWEASA